MDTAIASWDGILRILVAIKARVLTPITVKAPNGTARLMAR